MIHKSDSERDLYNIVSSCIRHFLSPVSSTNILKLNINIPKHKLMYLNLRLHSLSFRYRCKESHQLLRLIYLE